MAKLLYLMQMSLDGYVADASGNFDWAAPDEEVHRFVNDLERGTGTFLLGRRMYEVLSAWEDPAIAVGQPAHIADFHHIWISAEKIVYSRSLQDVSTAKTRIERELVPSTIERMKESEDRDLTIGGPMLAAEALRAELIDELHFIVVPHMAGGGNRVLRDGVARKVELVAESRFSSGAVYLGYRTSR